MSLRNLILGFLSIFFVVNAYAGVVLQFEDLVDSEVVGNKYSSLGVVFNNGVALSSGISLNELDFPPHSGNVVIGDDLSNALEIFFVKPVSDVSGWFTFSSGLLIDAFDVQGNLLGSISAGSNSNLGSSNEVLINFKNIGRLSFANTPVGSFVLDDLEFTVAELPPEGTVPEPPVALLMLISMAAIFAVRRF